MLSFRHPLIRILLLPVILLLIGAPASPGVPHGSAVALQRRSSDPEIASAPYAVHLPLVVRPEKWPAMNRAFELRFIELLNQERARHGLGPVSEEPCLVAAARRHARDMAVTGFVGHTGSDGSLPPDRIIQEGCVAGQFGGEVAGGNATPELGLAGFLDSPPHRAILLQPGVTRIGLGVQRFERGRVGHYAIVGVPGHPAPPPPPPPQDVDAALMARLSAHRAAHSAPPPARNAALDRVARRAFERLDFINRTDGAPYSNFCVTPEAIRYSEANGWATQEGYGGNLDPVDYRPIHAACIFDANGKTAEQVVDAVWAFAAQNPNHFSLARLADPAHRGVGVAVGNAFRSFMVVIVVGDSP